MSNHAGRNETETRAELIDPMLSRVRAANHCCGVWVMASSVVLRSIRRMRLGLSTLRLVFGVATFARRSGMYALWEIISGGRTPVPRAGPTHVMAVALVLMRPTTKKFLVVQTEGKRQVERQLQHYNLDATRGGKLLKTSLQNERLNATIRSLRIVRPGGMRAIHRQAV